MPSGRTVFIPCQHIDAPVTIECRFRASGM